MKRLEYRDTQDVQLACKLLSVLHQFLILHIQNLFHTEAVVIQDSEREIFAEGRQRGFI
jgi:hypothetical protein